MEIFILMWVEKKKAKLTCDAMLLLTRISVHPVNSAKLLTAVEADADVQRESSAPMCAHPAS